MQEVYALAQALEKATGVHIHFSQLDRMCKVSAGQGCVFGHCYTMHGEGAYVASDGKIYACSSLVGEPQYLIGDVCNGGFDIEKAKKVGEQVAAAMQACRECKLFGVCGGGCFTRWRGHGGKAAEECAMYRVFSRHV